VRLIAASLSITLLVLSACSPKVPPPPSKIEGPSVDKLTHEELMAALQECDLYGAHDDPRVRYTERYCAAVTSAHAMEGFTTKSTAKVDPSLPRLH
jgi:hypothetical protein